MSLSSDDADAAGEYPERLPSIGNPETWGDSEPRLVAAAIVKDCHNWAYVWRDGEMEDLLPRKVAIAATRRVLGELLAARARLRAMEEQAPLHAAAVALAERDAALAEVARLKAGAGGSFLSELQALINRRSMEKGSNTPDFILAAFMLGCLREYEAATVARTRWYGPWSGLTAPESIPRATAEDIACGADRIIYDALYRHERVLDTVGLARDIAAKLKAAGWREPKGGAG